MSANQSKAWHSLNLGDALFADESLERIKSIFRSLYDDGRQVENRAVYIRHESEGRLHCDVHVYFPAATASLARQVGAKPCNRPGTDDLGVLIDLNTTTPPSVPE